MDTAVGVRNLQMSLLEGVSCSCVCAFTVVEGEYHRRRPHSLCRSVDVGGRQGAAATHTSPFPNHNSWCSRCMALSADRPASLHNLPGAPTHMLFVAFILLLLPATTVGQPHGSEEHPRRLGAVDLPQKAGGGRGWEVRGRRGRGRKRRSGRGRRGDSVVGGGPRGGGGTGGGEGEETGKLREEAAAGGGRRSRSFRQARVVVLVGKTDLR